MTIPPLPADRPIPDTDDLRLLAELINNAYIPLANAAWNARMSQAEAALRLVSMAERGLPLRLVADGDRQALWHLAQAGPATGGVPPAPAVPAGSGGVAGSVSGGLPSPVPGSAPGAPSGPLSVSGAPSGSIPVSNAGPAVPGYPPPAVVPAAPVPLQPVPAAPLPPAPVPPHEQAIAGAVPLGQPPSGAAAGPDPAARGTVQEPSGPVSVPQPISIPSPVDVPLPGDAPPPVDVPAPAPAPTESASDPWGPAGSSSWTRSDDATTDGSHHDTGSPAESPTATTYYEPTGDPSSPADNPIVPTGGLPLTVEPGSGVAAEASSAARPSDTAPANTPAQTGTAPAHAGTAPAQWASLPVSGPAGEQLVVTVLQVMDPADRLLTEAGYRIEPGQRAVLVHSSVRNDGPAHYHPVGDLNLVLETDQHMLLGRAAMAIPEHPAYPVGVAAGETADGWSVFLIPATTTLAGVKWCIRPDFPQTILSWPIAP